MSSVVIVVMVSASAFAADPRLLYEQHGGLENIGNRFRVLGAALLINNLPLVGNLVGSVLV